MLPSFLERADSALVELPGTGRPELRGIWSVVHPDVHRSARVGLMADLDRGRGSDWRSDLNLDAANGSFNARGFGLRRTAAGRLVEFAGGGSGLPSGTGDEGNSDRSLWECSSRSW